MSKNQVWKIIHFFRTNRPEKIICRISRLENDQTSFHTFQDSLEPWAKFLDRQL